MGSCHKGHLCRLCLSGNAENHNHKDAYDRHNHKKMIEHFLMTMIMSMIVLMS